MTAQGPVVLIIMDGVGSAEPSPGNAVTQAKTPFLRSAWNRYPHGLLYTCAEYVGLPKGVKGNSEVGHTNIGAGQVVYQYLPRIDQSIAKKTFEQNSAMQAFLQTAGERQTAIHLMGCLSDGEVHSSIEHLQEILRIIATAKLKNKVYIHAFTDGRDTPPESAADYLQLVEKWISEYGVGQIASVTGRQFAMDRNKFWPRIQKVYDMLTIGKAPRLSHWQPALDATYQEGKNDQFVEPHLIAAENTELPIIQENDLVFFYNFRPDRAVELTTALTKPDFTGFQREKFFPNLHMMTMTRYSKEQTAAVMFPPVSVKVPIGRVISEQGLVQLRIAETQKYPHVTYFANGGNNIVFPGEDRVHIPSRNDVTYDQAPEMSIDKVTSETLRRLDMKRYDFILLNFANGDMVGHTGVLEAGVKAVEYVDWAVNQVVKRTLSYGGTAIVTADHGNVEEMVNLRTGGIDTEHSIFPVPIMIVQEGQRSKYLGVGKLADIAPTILRLMNISIPSDMTGQSMV